jgi:hypothetical protein
LNANGARGEPWPWILMAGPAIVVVAGLVTAWLAVRSDDGLVFDDYYKQGLAINQTLSRTDAAARLGIEAELYLVDGSVRAVLRAAVPGALTLRLAHPTRAGMDQSVELRKIGQGVYEGRLRPLRAGRWHVVLEQRDWRLAGDWIVPAAGALVLGVHAPPAAGAGHSKDSKEGKR